MSRARQMLPSPCVFRPAEVAEAPTLACRASSRLRHEVRHNLELLRRKGYLVARAPVHEPRDTQTQRALEADAPGGRGRMPGECRRR